jgi:hypothetical protein
MKKIEVPGLGIREFPDGMSEEEMANAIDAELAQQNQPSSETQQPAAEPVSQPDAEPVAPGPFDLSESQSAIRQIGDPLAAGAAVVGNAAYDAVKYAATHPFETGVYATGASFIPGVNKLPVIRDIKSARERYFGNQQGTAGGPIREGPAKGFTPGTGQKIPITPSQPVQPNAPGQPQPGQFARGQFNMPQQPNMQTGMPSDVRMQQGQMSQPDKAQIFSNPNANNYIPRVSELAKEYASAQQAVQAQPKAQPQPKPSGFPRGTFRGGGGGGGGGGGAMVFDPTQRRKPLQF